MKEDIDAIIAARRSAYGHPMDDFNRAAAIKSVLHEMPDPVLRHSADMIATKLARLIQTPDHEDSWKDIAGYALCALEVIKERQIRDDQSRGVYCNDQRS